VFNATFKNNGLGLGVLTPLDDNMLGLEFITPLSTIMG
jgi:hypothetical protein